MSQLLFLGTVKTGAPAERDRFNLRSAVPARLSSIDIESIVLRQLFNRLVQFSQGRRDNLADLYADLEQAFRFFPDRLRLQG